MAHPLSDTKFQWQSLHIIINLQTSNNWQRGRGKCPRQSGALVTRGRDTVSRTFEITPNPIPVAYNTQPYTIGPPYPSPPAFCLHVCFVFRRSSVNINQLECGMGNPAFFCVLDDLSCLSPRNRLLSLMVSERGTKSTPVSALVHRSFRPARSPKGQPNPCGHYGPLPQPRESSTPSSPLRQRYGEHGPIAEILTRCRIAMGRMYYG